MGMRKSCLYFLDKMIMRQNKIYSKHFKFTKFKKEWHWSIDRKIDQ